MTITEPLTTESAIEPEATLDHPVEEVTIDLRKASPVEIVEFEPKTSLLRDPLLPFLVLGTLSLVAMIVSAYLLSSSTFSF